MPENDDRPASTRRPHRGEADRRPVLRGVALGCALVLAAALTGCGSSTPSSSSATTAATATTYPADKQQVCQARDQLKTSVTGLTDPSLLTEGSTAITAAVSQVKTDLGNLKSAAGQDYQPQIQALQSSVDDLQTAAGNLGGGNVVQNMATVGTAIAAVGTSASTLFDQLKASCG